MLLLARTTPLNQVAKKTDGLSVFLLDMQEAKKNGSPVPITEIIDGYYAEVQEMGGNRWDSSGLIARLKKKK